MGIKNLESSGTHTKSAWVRKWMKVGEFKIIQLIEKQIKTQNQNQNKLNG